MCSFWWQSHCLNYFNSISFFNSVPVPYSFWKWLCTAYVFFRLSIKHRDPNFICVVLFCVYSKCNLQWSTVYIHLIAKSLSGLKWQNIAKIKGGYYAYVILFLTFLIIVAVETSNTDWFCNTCIFFFWKLLIINLYNNNTNNGCFYNTFHKYPNALYNGCILWCHCKPSNLQSWGISTLVCTLVCFPSGIGCWTGRQSPTLIQRKNSTGSLMSPM